MKNIALNKKCGEKKPFNNNSNNRKRDKRKPNRIKKDVKKDLAQKTVLQEHISIQIANLRIKKKQQRGFYDNNTGNNER